MYKAVRLRWLVVARLESAGLETYQIAQCTSFPYRKVVKILDDPAYQEWRNARIRNGISAIDAVISQDAQEMKLSLRELVPAAIRALERALESPKEEIQLRAATEILDRDERFNKHAQLTVTHQLIPAGDLERARAIARELRPKDLAQLQAAEQDAVPQAIDVTGTILTMEDATQPGGAS